MPSSTRTSEKPKPVGIWLRVSTEDQVKGESPEHHEKRARLYAEAKGWDVRAVYRLDAVSGKSVMPHPEAQRMLGDVKAGRITGLIFSKLARLARNTKELLEFSDRFREAGADLVSLYESIDTSSPAGRLFYTMIAAMAQWEREEIAERVAASVPIRARLGKPIAGAAPYGYQWKDKKLVPHPTEAPIRRRIYDLYVEHQRVKTVVRLLNEAGYRTRRGKPWNHTAVAWLIEDPTAKGERRANYTRERTGTKGWEYKPESEWVVTAVEPVVPAELWDRANAIMAEGKATRRRHGRPPVRPFGGRLVCACGTKMYANTKGVKYLCRSCRNKIGVSDLEAIFHQELQTLVLSPEIVAQHLEEANETLTGKQEVLAAHEAESARVTREMEKVYRLYVGDELTPDGFGRLYRPLETRKRELDDELPRLQAEIDVMRIRLLSQDEIISHARDVYAQWPAFTAEERRALVEGIVDRIEVGKDGVEIILSPAALPLRNGATTAETHRTSAGTRRSGPPAWGRRRAGRRVARRWRC